MRFVRGERAEQGVTVADGEAGRGVYFCLERNMPMVAYYLSDACRSIVATPKKGCFIVDLTTDEMSTRLLAFTKEQVELLAVRMGPYFKRPSIDRGNIQRFATHIMSFIFQCCPKADAYLVKHHGVGVPSGKQLIVRNMEAFDIQDMKKEDYWQDKQKRMR